MDRLGRWLGKKKPERTSCVTRSTASPSATRVSYNEEIVPLELLDVPPAKAMAFPCGDFMEAAGIQEEFNALCANASLTRLATCRVLQYHKLTAISINSFRFYPDDDTVVFRVYDKLLTMPMSNFCEALGFPDEGEKVKKNSQTAAIKTLLDLFCSTDARVLIARRSPTFCFPTSGISRIILPEGCWLETTRATLLRLILLSWRMPSRGNMSIMWVR